MIETRRRTHELVGGGRPTPVEAGAVKKIYANTQALLFDRSMISLLIYYTNITNGILCAHKEDLDSSKGLDC